MTMTLRLFLLATLIAMMPSSTYAQGCLETANLSKLRMDHLDKVNSIRSRNGLNALVQNDLLNAVAQDYACLLAASGHFDHVGPDGSTLSERIRAGGYEFCVAAENLASGQQSILEAIVGWVRSPGHYRNLKQPDVTEIGLGAAYPDPSAAPSRPGAAADGPPQTLGDLVRSYGVEVPAVNRGRQNYLWVQVFGAPCDGG